MKKNSKEKLLEIMRKINSDLELVLEQQGGKEYNVIGFANKYYTLWKVTEKENWIEYEYIQNLSYDLDKAKEKSGTELVNDKLKGRTKSFRVVKFNNGMTQEFEADLNDGKSFSVDYVIRFGKYKGQSILEIANKDPQYLAWMVRNVDPTRNRRLIIFLSMLLPVKNVLENDPKFKEKTEKLKTQEEELDEEVAVAIENANKYYSEKYNSNVFFNRSKDGKTVSSNIISFNVNLKKPYAKQLPRNKNTGIRTVRIDNVQTINGVFKLDKDFRYNIIKINNLEDPNEIGTPIKTISGDIGYYNFNSDISDKTFEIHGDFRMHIQTLIEKNYNDTFIVNKVLMK